MSKKLVFIDGINRTGKKLAGSLISSFDKMEHLEFGEVFQHIVPAIRYKKISEDFAKAFIHNYLNQLIYNKYLSRNVNFRRDDRTGIYNSINKKKYIKRLKEKEGDEIIKKIISEKPIIPFVTHDIICNYSNFLKLNIDIKIIEFFRNPIDVIYSWHKKKLVQRYGTDKRIFTLLLQNKNQIVSQHMHPISRDWNKINNLEKCILYVNLLVNRSVKEIKRNKKKNFLYITSYENLISNTESELQKISKFINTKFSSQTKKFIKKEKCPKIIDKKEKNKKLDFIKKNISEKYIKILNKMIFDYEVKKYDLPQLKK